MGCERRTELKVSGNAESATPLLRHQPSAAPCWQTVLGPDNCDIRWKRAGPLFLGHGSTGPEASQGPGPGLVSAGDPERTLDWVLASVLVGEPDWDTGSHSQECSVTEQAVETGGGRGHRVEGPRKAS